jgi:ribose-phosphate pyrophosphokinase
MIFIDGHMIKNGRFPNGELKLNTEEILKYGGIPGLGENSIHTLSFKYTGDESLFEMLMTARYLREHSEHLVIRLFYMPYSRMDRKQGSNDAFTLKYVCEMINAIGADEIRIYEPHSDVTLALLDNVVWYNTTKHLLHELGRNGELSATDYLMFPDAGAQKKYGAIFPNPQLLGIKHREWKTGKITDFKVYPEGVVSHGQKAFIVDDLCAKGTTAYNAALALKACGFEDINLVVAHCEDSVFDGKLLLDDSPINKIYTTDSILTKNHEKIVQLLTME